MVNCFRSIWAIGIIEGEIGIARNALQVLGQRIAGRRPATRYGQISNLAFYDAIAPVVDAETIDHDAVFPGLVISGGGEDGVMVNCFRVHHRGNRIIEGEIGIARNALQVLGRRCACLRPATRYGQFQSRLL